MGAMTCLKSLNAITASAAGQNTEIAGATTIFTTLSIGANIIAKEIAGC